MVEHFIDGVTERFPTLERLYLDWHNIESLRMIPDISLIYTGDSGSWSEIFYETLAMEFLIESGLNEDEAEALAEDFLVSSLDLVERTLIQKLREYTKKHRTFTSDGFDEGGNFIVMNQPVRSVW